jgi:ribosomal subunit interface protein
MEVAVMDIQVIRPASIAQSAAGYARQKIGHLARYSREPIRFVRVAFSASGNPAAAVRVRASIDVDGRVLQAVTQAATAREAIDAVDAKLRRQLVRVNPHWEARRGRTVSIGRRIPGGTNVPSDREAEPYQAADPPRTMEREGTWETR